ncbi:MAG: hypothetical protein R3310_17115 [Candidatus Competibacteraceae bacterium]|nr:hypothetical protein [Candidatus Competibacteraceae bacterium]
MTGAVLCWAVALLSDIRGWRWPAGLSLLGGLILIGVYWPKEPALGTVLTGLRPEAAFLSVWLLVLLPILDQRLDRGVLIVNLRQGGVALAGVALSVGITLKLWPVLPVAGGGTIVLLLCLSPLHFAGLVLCRPGGSFVSWAYPAWAASWLSLVLPALADLGLPLADHGVGALVLSYGAALPFWQGLRRSGPVRWLWLIAALPLPFLLGLLLGGICLP